jgi:hypothetical protein
MRTILAVLAIAVVLVGCGGASASQATSASVAPSMSGTFGGTVTFQVDGRPATTVVEAMPDGTGISGTAVTTFATGTHTVRLECFAVGDGGYVLAGTVEATTVPGETAGHQSAVIVRDGSPQRIGIWLSGEDAGSCDDFVEDVDPASIDPSNFSDIESGELVAPG